MDHVFASSISLQSFLLLHCSSFLLPHHPPTTPTHYTPTQLQMKLDIEKYIQSHGHGGKIHVQQLPALIQSLPALAPMVSRQMLQQVEQMSAQTAQSADNRSIVLGADEVIQLVQVLAAENVPHQPPQTPAGRSTMARTTTGTSTFQSSTSSHPHSSTSQLPTANATASPILIDMSQDTLDGLVAANGEYGTPNSALSPGTDQRYFAPASPWPLSFTPAPPRSVNAQHQPFTPQQQQLPTTVEDNTASFHFFASNAATVRKSMMVPAPHAAAPELSQDESWMYQNCDDAPPTTDHSQRQVQTESATKEDPSFLKAMDDAPLDGLLMEPSTPASAMKQAGWHGGSTDNASTRRTLFSQREQASTTDSPVLEAFGEASSGVNISPTSKTGVPIIRGSGHDLFPPSFMQSRHTMQKP